MIYIVIIIIIFLIIVIFVMYRLSNRDIKEKYKLELIECNSSSNYNYWKIKSLPKNEVPVIYVNLEKKIYYWGVIGYGNSISSLNDVSCENLAIIVTQYEVVYEKIKYKIASEWKKKKIAIDIVQLDSDRIDIIQAITKNDVPIFKAESYRLNFSLEPKTKEKRELEINVENKWLDTDKKPLELFDRKTRNSDLVSYVTDWLTLKEKEKLTIYAMDYSSIDKNSFSMILIEDFNGRILRFYNTSSSSISEEVYYSLEPKIEIGVKFRIIEECYIKNKTVFPFQSFIDL